MTGFDSKRKMAQEQALKKLADLGQEIEQEPVAMLFGSLPVYDTPPAAQRPWVGLDEDDIRKLYGKDLNYRDGNYVRYAMAVEAKLKEKNGY